MGLKEFTNLQITIKSASQVVLPDVYVPGARSNAEQTVYLNDFAVQESLTPTTTPAPVAVLAETVVIPGGGSYSLDLTAAKIVGAVSGTDPAATEDLTGKKLMYMELHTDPDNAAVVNIAPAAANGYDLFGAGLTDGIDLPADSHMSFYCKDSSLPDVAAADLGITISGTAADIITVVMVFEA
jgi:hypothetical protein